MKKLFTILIALFCLFSVKGECAPARIGQITVNVRDSSGQTSLPVLNRMAKSIDIVSEQMLINKDVLSVSQNKNTYIEIFTDICNRVFTGYQTEKIFLTEGSTTNIDILVKPWGAVVENIHVETYFSGIDSFWQPYIIKNIGDVKGEVSAILNGVSVDAVDWASSVVAENIRLKLSENAPYLKAGIDIKYENNKTSAEIFFVPVDETVKGINFDLSSDTVPTLVLLDAKKSLLDFSGSLRGLPIKFVEKNKSDIEHLIAQKAQAERISSYYDLKAHVAITPGIDTPVSIKLDSPQYRIWIEGYADIDKEDENLAGKLHIGRLISDKDEIFLETTLYVNDVKWKFDPGISRNFGKTKVSALYRFPNDQAILRFEYDFLKNWRFRIEKYSSIKRPEIALRYRIHEFLSLEMVYGNDKDKYLRIIGNL